MNTVKRFKMGGILLTIGSSLALLVIITLLIITIIFDTGMPMDYMIVSALFGHWIAMLIFPPTIEGVAWEFDWIYLLGVPWAAVFIVFLLWMGVQFIRGRYKIELVQLSLMVVLGSWLIILMLYKVIFEGFGFFEYDLAGLLNELIPDVASIAIIMGIGLILFRYKKTIKSLEKTISKDNLDEQEQNTNVLAVGRKPLNKNKIGMWIGFVCGILWTILSIASKGKVPGGAQGGVVGFIIGYILTRLVLAFIPSGEDEPLQEESEDVTLLPTINCPECNEAVNLKEDERSNKKFTCPWCEKFIDLT